jgi:hypothetical protein
MSVVIAQNLVLGDIVSGGGVINANNPLIGYQQLATTGNISATTEAAGFPASFLVNPSTNLRWEGVIASPAADEYITLDLNTEELVDYIGIARHNFFSAQIPVSIETLDEGSPESWTEIISSVIPPNDGPLLFRFAPQGITSIRIRMQPGNAAPTAAVVYAGKLLVLQRRLYVGHTPINMGRNTKVSNQRSESGNFLGRIILSETTSTQFTLKNLTPVWYRAYIEPFLAGRGREDAFFFAWRPSDYPYEIGYCWLTSDATPQNDLTNGMMSISFDVAGIV